MFNAVGNFTDVYTALPTVPSTPMFYGIDCGLFLRNVTVASLGGLLLATSLSSLSALIGAEVRFVDAAGMFDFSAGSQAEIAGVRIKSGTFRNTFLSIAHSQIALSDVTLSDIAFPSLVNSLTSVCFLSQITLRRVSADVLFPQQIASSISLSGLSISDSMFDLMQVSRGTVAFRNLSITNHRIKRQFLVATQANITLESVSISGVIGEKAGALIFAQKQSQVSILSASIIGLSSSEQGLVLCADTDFSLVSALVSGFNVTFMVATTSNVSVSLSSIQDGGRSARDKLTRDMKKSGFLDCEDCPEVAFLNSSFLRLHGTSGGSLSAVRKSSVSIGKVVIYACEFAECTAEKDGGAVRLMDESAYIAFTSLRNNSADRGGAVSLICEGANSCRNSITACEFLANSAVEGGAISWLGERPSLSANLATGNKAVYGPFEASEVSSLFIVNETQAVVQPPGQRLSPAIALELRDFLDQVVLTDNSTAIELSILGGQGVELLGERTIVVANGVGIFSALMIRSAPNTQLRLQAIATSSETKATLDFQISLRECVPGEVTSAEGCYPCPKGSYSVDPQDSNCHPCPSSAECPGAAKLILLSDYWRSSLLSDAIFLCPEQGLCNGGELAKCGDGYQGRLCAVCASGYFSYGHSYCFPCENRYVFIAIVLSASLVPLITLSWTIFRTVNPTIIGPRTVSLRIIFGFLQGVLIASCIGVGWKFELSLLMIATEGVLSLGASTIPTACFGGSLSWVYWKAIIASLVPVTAVLCAVAFFKLKHFAFGRRRNSHETAKAAVVVLHFLCFYTSKSTVDLVICREMEEGSYWLAADVSQKCWEGEHAKYAKMLFTPLALLFLLGYPSILLGSLYKTRSSEWSTALRFLTAGLLSERREWEAWLAVRRAATLLAITALTYTARKIQILAALGVVYLSLSLQLFRSPYVSSLHNLMEVSVQGATLLLVSVSFYFQDSLPLSYTAKSAVGYAICSLVLLYFLFLLACLVRGKLRKERMKEEVTPVSEEAKKEGSYCSEKNMVAPANSFDMLAYNDSKL